jgi:hypothetical protein
MAHGGEPDHEALTRRSWTFGGVLLACAIAAAVAGVSACVGAAERNAGASSGTSGDSRFGVLAAVLAR